MINGRRHGDLTNKIIDKIKAQRRIAAGLDSEPANLMNLPNKSPEDIRRRELEGGIVIVGRPTFKEFMAGLKRGWTESLEIVDREEALSNQLSTDGRFDEPEEELQTGVELGDVDGEPIPTASKLPPSQPMSILTAPQLRSPGVPVRPPPAQKSTIPEALNAPPPTIPAMPPLLLVSFINHIGLTQIPLMMWEFFNEREKVRSGAEAAYRLIMGQSRPFIAPPPSLNNSEFVDEDGQTSSPSQPHQSELSSSPIPTDLEFDVDAEPYYKKSYVNDFADEIAKAREGYYKSLPEKLATTRSLARGEREPTKDEKSYPPPTEVELRAERMKKELRWTSDEAGWDIIRPSKPIEWDERLRGILHVFVDPSEEVVASTKPDAEGSTS
ncbi:hypothetical protein NLI96_g12372 [Meripilus lineatus]|uniref:Mitochondrial import inner membrane translocase subunit TIM54 n=1 Tax=Meripilus lineatus TaxID=2056292 RepID=A0AAD5USG3_9APHY|nr:hypothetical protein NLI96_g12372 [Physisporinus lineatus]